MTDFKQYDEAVLENLKRIRLNIMPLQCWDFFGNSFKELSENLADSRNIQFFALENKWVFEADYQEALENNTTIIVTNPNIEIVYSSANVIKMNGYKPDEIIGKSPKMFQGIETSKEITAQIGNAIRQKKPFEQTIVNYHKDGSAYDCHIKGFPVFNIKGQLCHFIAFEKVA